MASYDVAHLREQGQDIIIVIVRQQPSSAQINTLQLCANRAGLRGTVCPVWDSFGTPKFIAPHPWHPFFRSLSWDIILTNVNKRLTCG